MSERIERLEAQAASQNNAQANIETLNRLNALQQEVASLRGLVEQLQNENAQLKQAAREQYIDLDSRLGRLEGGSAPVAGTAATPADGAAPSPADPTVAPTDAAPATPVPAAPRGVVADVATGAPAPADPAGERPMYDSAFQALRDGEYAEASRRFQAYLETYPAGTLAPNAWYWLGESYYVTQNYDVALTAFESLLQAFPDSAKAPDALLKLGYCQFELGRAPQGEATLRDVIARYPGSDAARLAQSRLRSLALDAG
ncbi:tol-pal system protein YbgF [Silanimonas sp.]|uniref:tol-pal system protein YbgF n=1 Tax=Silanimonas sp. TaxID=1929290 RepID=UPI0037C984F8